MSTMVHHQTQAKISEEEAWIAAAKENPQAFGALYNKYYEPILKFIYLRVNTKDEAFDLAQQVFLKALNKIQSYKFMGLPYSSYLYRIAMNELNQHFRNKKKFRSVNLETEHLENLLIEMEHPEEVDRIPMLVEKIKRLSSADFLLVEMRYFEKRSFKEIADILEIIENNAKVKTYRAMDRLKRLF